MTQRGKSTQVAVVGAGGVGGFLASRLAQAGHVVTLCVRTPFDRLIVEIGEEASEVPARIASSPAGLGRFPWVFVTTKAQDTAAARDWLATITGPETVVVVVQNGVEHVARVASLVRTEAILPALIYAGVERIAPGHVRLHTPGRMTVPAGALGARFAELIADGAIEVNQERDFVTAVWRKVLTNVAANPITALTMQRIGVFHQPEVRDLADKLLAEAVAVARAEGAEVTLEDAARTLALHAGYDPATGTSMLYDRLAGRRLEHEYITGAVVRAAERHGIATPFNRAILALLRALDGARLAPPDGPLPG